MGKKKQILAIEDISPDANNANAGTAKGAELLAHSMTQVGAGRGVLVDVNGIAVAGNKSLAAWQAAGGKIRVVETTGDVLVVTQRIDLDLESDDKEVRERSRLAAYLDNRVGQISLSWDGAVVAADIESGLDLSAIFEPAELDTIISPFLHVEPAPMPDFGDFPDTPVAPTDAAFIAFKFGDYAGKVERSVYDAFVAKYQHLQSISTEVMLGDVLRVWLELAETTADDNIPSPVGATDVD